MIIRTAGAGVSKTWTLIIDGHLAVGEGVYFKIKGIGHRKG